MSKFLKLNKRVYPFIRHPRVGNAPASSLCACILFSRNLVKSSHKIDRPIIIGQNSLWNRIQIYSFGKYSLFFRSKKIRISLKKSDIHKKKLTMSPSRTCSASRSSKQFYRLAQIGAFFCSAQKSWAWTHLKERKKPFLPPKLKCLVRLWTFFSRIGKFPLVL